MLCSPPKLSVSPWLCPVLDMSWPAPPGSSVQVVAVVQPSFRSAHPPSEMEELGFGMLELLDSFTVIQSGKSGPRHGSVECMTYERVAAEAGCCVMCAGSHHAYQAYVFRKTDDAAKYKAAQLAHEAADAPRLAAVRRGVETRAANRQEKARRKAEGLAKRKATRARKLAQKQSGLAEALQPSKPAEGRPSKRRKL